MGYGIILIIVLLLIIFVWISVEFKRAKHKFYAVLVIILILFTYFTFSSAFKDKNPNFKSLPGIIDASKIYFSFLGNVFGNIKSITSGVINADWSNSTTQKKK